MLIVQRHEGRTLRAIGSCVIDRDTEGDAPEPNAEPRRVGNQVEISERAKEGFLGDVIGIRGANEREGERIHHPLISTDELPERVAGRVRARSRSGHELGVGLAIGDRFRESQRTDVWSGGDTVASVSSRRITLWVLSTVEFSSFFVAGRSHVTVSAAAS